MKMKGTLIFATCVLLVAVLAFVFVPKFFPIPQQESSSVSTSSAQEIPPKTTAEMIALSDTVITGKVIKADVHETGVLYTFEVVKVYKGRNYTSMGYAEVQGPKTLSLTKTYLFFGAVPGEKYHYAEPFSQAPWVFEVGEGNALTHTSNGLEELLTDRADLSLDRVKLLCDEAA